ncbi:hypothetical protein OG229_34675 [Streptomyces platensis]|nr:hypothetical protein OG229_34675 [Streptomyces platensis]
MTALKKTSMDRAAEVRKISLTKIGWPGRATRQVTYVREPLR